VNSPMLPPKSLVLLLGGRSAESPDLGLQVGNRFIIRCPWVSDRKARQGKKLQPNIDSGYWYLSTRLLQEQGPSSPPTGSKAFSWTPATMIAVGNVGLILFFFFTAHHP
jgi:hypothetical protein